MAPFTDEDIYGKNYEPSQEEIDARAASIAAYEEEIANLGVIGSIESLYAIHMIELTGSRLIELPANLSKLVPLYNEYSGEIVPGTEGQYTESSREAYLNAEAFAKSLIDAGDANVTPSMVNTATTELVYAWKRLEVCADYSKLDQAITAAAPIFNANGDDAEAQSAYTVESYQAFLDAYNAATGVSRDLGASDNEYLNSLATSLDDARVKLAPATAAEPTFEIVTDEIYPNPTWDMFYAPYLDEDTVASFGSVELIDGTNVDAFLILGNNIGSDADVLQAFGSVENGEIIVTPNENGYSTGALAQVVDGSGEVVKTFVIVARGDVTGEGAFDDVDAAEMDIHGNFGYDWFWNSYGTYDQYKAVAGDTTGDANVDSSDGELLGLAVNYQGYYDMIYGGEM